MGLTLPLTAAPTAVGIAFQAESKMSLKLENKVRKRNASAEREREKTDGEGHERQDTHHSSCKRESYIAHCNRWPVILMEG